MPPISVIIRDLRRVKGLSQSELAKRAGLTQPTISEAERGIIVPTIENYVAIIGALGLHVDLSPKEHHDPTRARLDLALARLNADQRETIVRLAELLPLLPRPLVDALLLVPGEMTGTPRR